MPTILTTVETTSFSGFLWPQILDVFPEQVPIERTSMNSWDSPAFRAAVAATGRKKIVVAALWTEVCLTFPALEMLKAGFEVYAVADASGGTSTVAHDLALQRVTQAGAVPVTALQFLLEMQRDWADHSHYNDVMAIVKDHAGAYGVGIEYCSTLVHHNPSSRKLPNAPNAIAAATTSAAKH